MKKILSILLILAMALSFTVMAFAEEKKDDPRRRTRSQKKICLNC